MGVHSVATCLSKFFIEVYQVFGDATNRNMWQINVVYIYIYIYIYKQWILNMNEDSCKKHFKLLPKT